MKENNTTKHKERAKNTNYNLTDLTFIFKLTLAEKSNNADEINRSPHVMIHLIYTNKYEGDDS